MKIEVRWEITEQHSKIVEVDDDFDEDEIDDSWLAEIEDNDSWLATTERTLLETQVLDGD
jgi:hypothetical protein